MEDSESRTDTPLIVKYSIAGYFLVIMAAAFFIFIKLWKENVTFNQKVALAIKKQEEKITTLERQQP